MKVFKKQTTELVANIAAARTRCGMTQKQLAGRIQMPESTMSERIRNPETFKVYDLLRIAEATHTTIEALVRAERN